MWPLYLLASASYFVSQFVIHKLIPAYVADISSDTGLNVAWTSVLMVALLSAVAFMALSMLLYRTSFSALEMTQIFLAFVLTHLVIVNLIIPISTDAGVSVGSATDPYLQHFGGMALRSLLAGAVFLGLQWMMKNI